MIKWATIVVILLVGLVFCQPASADSKKNNAPPPRDQQPRQQQPRPQPRQAPPVYRPQYRPLIQRQAPRNNPAPRTYNVQPSFHGNTNSAPRPAIKSHRGNWNAGGQSRQNHSNSGSTTLYHPRMSEQHHGGRSERRVSGEHPNFYHRYYQMHHRGHFRMRYANYCGYPVVFYYRSPDGTICRWIGQVGPDGWAAIPFEQSGIMVVADPTTGAAVYQQACIQPGDDPISIEGIDPSSVADEQPQSEPDQEPSNE